MSVLLPTVSASERSRPMVHHAHGLCPGLAGYGMRDAIAGMAVKVQGCSKRRGGKNWLAHIPES